MFGTRLHRCTSLTKFHMLTFEVACVRQWQYSMYFNILSHTLPDGFMKGKFVSTQSIGPFLSPFLVKEVGFGSVDCFR